MQHTFQQRNLTWPVHPTARPRHRASPPVFEHKTQKKWNISTLWLLSHQSWDLRRFEVGSAGLCFNSDIGGSSIRLQWHPGGPGAYDGASLSRATHALLAVPGEHHRPVWLRGQRGYFTFSTERNPNQTSRGCSVEENFTKLTLQHAGNGSVQRLLPVHTVSLFLTVDI